MFAAILILGLIAAGFLVHRHQRRGALPSPVVPAAAEARELQAMDAWQRSIHLDTHTDYTKLDPETRERLRREEERQRPQEGRN